MPVKMYSFLVSEEQIEELRQTMTEEEIHDLYKRMSKAYLENKAMFDGNISDEEIDELCQKYAKEYPDQYKKLFEDSDIENQN